MNPAFWFGVLLLVFSAVSTLLLVDIWSGYALKRMILEFLGGLL